MLRGLAQGGEEAHFLSDLTGPLGMGSGQYFASLPDLMGLAGVESGQ